MGKIEVSEPRPDLDLLRRAPRASESPRANSRAALIDAALEEFSTKGYEAATVAGIAERAGVTTGALYAHFAGKLDLLLATVGLTPAEEVVDPLRDRQRGVFVGQQVGLPRGPGLSARGMDCGEADDEDRRGAEDDGRTPSRAREREHELSRECVSRTFRTYGRGFVRVNAELQPETRSLVHFRDECA